MGEVLELLKGLPFGGISFAGLVTLAIVLIFKGEIVPKSTMVEIRTGRDTIIASKDSENTVLKQANELLGQAIKTNSEADAEILELGRTTVQLLRSIQDQALKTGVK